MDYLKVCSSFFNLHLYILLYDVNFKLNLHLWRLYHRSSILLYDHVDFELVEIDHFIFWWPENFVFLQIIADKNLPSIPFSYESELMVWNEILSVDVSQIAFGHRTLELVVY